MDAHIWKQPFGSDIVLIACGHLDSSFEKSRSTLRIMARPTTRTEVLSRLRDKARRGEAIVGSGAGKLVI